jgi:hypothetical protein
MFTDDEAKKDHLLGLYHFGSPKLSDIVFKKTTADLETKIKMKTLIQGMNLPS